MVVAWLVSRETLAQRTGYSYCPGARGQVTDIFLRAGNKL